MRSTSIFRKIPVALAIGAFAFSLGVQAQTSTSANGGTPAAVPRAAAAPSGDVGTKPTVTQEIKSDAKKVGKATKRTAKKAVAATKRTGHKVANATRSVGDKMASKLPARGKMESTDGQGTKAATP